MANQHVSSFFMGKSWIHSDTSTISTGPCSTSQILSLPEGKWDDFLAEYQNIIAMGMTPTSGFGYFGLQSTTNTHHIYLFEWANLMLKTTSELLWSSLFTSKTSRLGLSQKTSRTHSSTGWKKGWSIGPFPDILKLDIFGPWPYRYPPVNACIVERSTILCGKTQ